MNGCLKFSFIIICFSDIFLNKMTLYYNTLVKGSRNRQRYFLSAEKEKEN